ncbi:flagellar assembly protein H [Parasalinivibrio latis]|uniref:flagellar assembly protein FliH n=1 Tax=Parasalinivibrio latis TaxID=2952610 RepID=UPI0030E3380C
MKKNHPLILHPEAGHYRHYHFPPLASQGDDLFGDDGGYHEEFQNGFEDGQQKGHAQGYQDGLTQGMEAGRQQGLDEGHQQGLQQGIEQVRQQLSGTVATADQLVKQIEQVFHNHVRQQSEMICDLVQKVARQVIRAELSLQPGQIVKLIEETLEQIPETKTGITVYLNPGDCQRLVDLVPEKVADWDLKQDPELAAGSCRVVTDDAEALADSEARLEACMDAVKDNLLTDA